MAKFTSTLKTRVLTVLTVVIATKALNSILRSALNRQPKAADR